MNTEKLAERLGAGAFDHAFDYLYMEKAAAQTARYTAALGAFEGLFGTGREAAFFSAPGRTEVCGNHTDHQHGRVLAASVNLDVVAVASKNSDRVIRIRSEGYPMDTIDLADLPIKEKEINKAASLIRGTAMRFRELGYEIGGFDAYTTSSVLKGSGLSSSAAFETIVGVMLSYLYNEGKISPVEIAQIGQYAENVYFGKPCGLMDQTASSVGGFVAIDFESPVRPIVERIPVDFARSGYKLCIVDTGGNHADLTGDYASVPVEMKSVAAVFGKQFLREVSPDTFFANIAKVRSVCTDRAMLRAVHFFADDARVPLEVAALRANNFDAFKKLIIESGHSSYMYLQNVYTCQNPAEQGLSLGLALSEQLLAGRGAWRVHGGGFAGTIQCFVPDDLLETYRAAMDTAFGDHHCHVLSIRPTGGTAVTENMGNA